MCGLARPGSSHRAPAVMTGASLSFRSVGLLVVLFLGAVCGRAAAQSNAGTSTSLAVRDVPLDRALEQAAAATDISLVYDVALVEGRRASCTVRDSDPEVLLQCLLEGHPLDYVRTSKGTYVLQKSIRRPPLRGHLAGVVRGGEQGDPLTNAHVQVPEAEDRRAAVTDSAGRFRIEGLLPGPHRLVVTHLGFERHEATVYVQPHATTRHEATLAAAPIAGDSILVNADRYGSGSAQGGQGEMSARQLMQTGTGGTPDVLEAAHTLLGVSSAAPYADLHIQDGDTGGHTVRLDGVPIRNPASAGRLLGAFSPLALDGLRARKAGFGALHGSALSGTIELKHDLSNRGTRYGSFRLDPRSLNVRMQGAASVGETPVTAMVAGRMSVWDIYQEAALHDLIDRWSTLDPVLVSTRIPADTSLSGGMGGRTQPDAGFYDVHGAARFELGPSEDLYVSAYHGGSHLGADLMLGKNLRGRQVHAANVAGNETSRVTLPTHDEYAWRNTAAQVRYEAPLGSRVVGEVQASVSHYQGSTHSQVGQVRTGPQTADAFARSTLRQAIYGQEGANEITQVDVESRFDAALGSRSGLSFVAGATYQASGFRIGNAFAPRLRHRMETVRLMGAGEATVGLGTHASVEGGIRVTGLPEQDRLFAEPRGAFRYNRTWEELGTVGVRVGGGLYRQFTTQFELSRDGATAVVPTTHVWLPVPASMPPSRTWHLALDATWQPNEKFNVDLEGYRKWQSHLLAIDYPALRTSPATLGTTPTASYFLGSSRGSAFGAGLHIEYEGRLATSSLTYAYSQASRTFPSRFDGRRTPVPWSEPHRLALKTEIPVGAGIALEGRGEGAWGRRWGYRRAYYAYLTPEDLGSAWERLQMDRPGRHILPPLYRFDVGVSVTQTWSGIKVQGRLGVQNVLNRRNVADWALQPYEDGTVSRWARSLPGRRASISVQVCY